MGRQYFYASLRTHPTCLSILKDLEALGKQICLKSRTNSWAAAVELCTKTWETSNILKVHGRLWVTINMMPLPLSTCTILDGQVRPFVNTVALTYLDGIASARSVGDMSELFTVRLTRRLPY